jgi:hypothetical protein
MHYRPPEHYLWKAWSIKRNRQFLGSILRRAIRVDDSAAGHGISPGFVIFDVAAMAQ